MTLPIYPFSHVRMLTRHLIVSRRTLVAHTLIGSSLAPLRHATASRNPYQQPSGTGGLPPMATASQQHSNATAALKILDEVYGPFHPGEWRPKAFERTAPRYLWTDAFGVCAYLSLYYSTGDSRLLQQAVALTDAVINTLGHERPASAGSGGSRSAGGSTSVSGSTSTTAWLRGASAEHPTAGGLRIGKPHPEGHPDGDGQYLHYLTKFAFALNQLAAATGDAKYLRWAVELMQTAHKAFTYKTSSGVPRMFWKMSIDLSHPAVNSMGNLDAYDSLVTCSMLQDAASSWSKHSAAAAAAVGEGSSASRDTAGADQGLGGAGTGSRVLQEEIQELQAMVDARYKSYSSDDPLDLGEALWLSHWQLPLTKQSDQLATQQSQQQPQQHSGPQPTVSTPLEAAASAHADEGAAATQGSSAWARHVAAVSLSNLEQLWTEGYFDQPLRWRLGFREFGTSIGLQALLAVRPDLPDAGTWRQRVQQIHDTWAGQLYTRDRDITPVMYATSLVPGVWLRQG